MTARKLSLFVSLTLLFGACTAQTVGDKMDSGGDIVIQGSDTEVQLVSTLVEAFAEKNPEANISVAGGGSAVGIAALINGETDVTNSSRTMKEEELAKAKEKGLNVQEFILARDGLSIVVHPSNTLTELSMDQLSRIFQGTATNWKDVGGADAPIVLYGRQSTSGTFGFFRDTVVKGDYAATMRQMEGSQAIVDAVQSDQHGIGYVGVGYIRGADGQAKKEIKIIPVKMADGDQAYSPLDKAAVESEKYPIARRIYQYVPAVPAKGSMLEKFLRFEASAEGQAIVEGAGFYATIGDDRTRNDAFFQAIK